MNAPHTHNGELNESTDEHEGWTAWSTTDSLPTEPSRYYLTADVTLSAKWEPASGETYLCLNGLTITGPDYHAIKVNSGCTLNLYDAQGDAGKVAVPDHSREVECVYIYSGTFNMYGGTLSGTSVSRGVYMDPMSPSSNTFNMYGGTISRFSVGFSGAGVYASGTFNMYDGSITGNSNTNTSGIAGGVFVYSDGTFNMSGGSITGNTAKSGSENVYVQGTFTRTGGTVGTEGNEGIGYLSNKTCAVSFDADGADAAYDFSRGVTGSITLTARFSQLPAPPDPPAEGPVEPEGVAFVRGKEVALKKGKKLTLEVRLIPENAETTLTFKSNNKKVARVSGKGVVKGKKKGRAKITVTTANGRKATIIVKVK